MLMMLNIDVIGCELAVDAHNMIHNKDNENDRYDRATTAVCLVYVIPGKGIQ